MNTNNIALRAAVVIALGAVPAVASATLYSPGLPVTLASELPFTGSNLINFDGATYGITIDMRKFINHSIGTSAPLEIKMTLTNGATFNGVVATDLTCNYNAAGGGAVAAASKLNGAASETLVTFKLPAGSFTAAAAEALCIFTGGINLTSGSKGGNAAYDMMVSSYLKSVIADEQVQDTIAGTVVGFRQAFGIVMTPGQVTIDVADPSLSQKFVTKANVIDGKNAVLGTLKYSVVSTSTVKISDNVGTIAPIGTIAGGGVAGADLLPTPLSITLSGTPLMAAAGGTTVSVGRGVGAVACDLIGATLPAASVKNPTVSGAVSFDDVTNLELIAGVTFCYRVDGLTRLDKGLVTFGITVPSDVNKQPNVAVTGDKVLTTFYKNGTSVKVLTIPDPTDLNNELNIRIYNMSTSSVKVYGSLYKIDGTLIGEKNTLLGSIDPNAVKVLKSGGPAPKNLDLANVFKVTTWGGGRAWMQIEGDSQQIRVQAIAKTAGTMVNMSDRVIEDSGTFKRPGTN